MLAIGKVDPMALAISLATSYTAYSIVRLLFQPPPFGIPHITRPPGLRGFLLRQMSIFIKASFGEYQLAYFEQARKRYGHGRGDAITFELWPGNWRILLSHPDDVDFVLHQRPESFVKGEDYDRLVPIIGAQNLVTIRDEKVHGEQRRLLNPAFSPHILKRIADTAIVGQIRHYLIELEKELHIKGMDNGTGARPGRSESNWIPADLGRCFDDIALSAVAEASFKKVNLAECDVREEFRLIIANSGLSIFGLFDKLALIVPSMRRMRRSAQRLRMLGLDIAREVKVRQQEQEHHLDELLGKNENGRSEGDENPNPGSPADDTLIDYLVREERITNSALLDHIVTFLFAGHESTSRSMLWTTYLLARHPAAQGHLHEELCGALALGAFPTLDQVKDLPYLQQVLKESLRLFPPFPAVIRNVANDEVLPHSKVFLPKGARIILTMFCIHRQPLIYGDDAKEFKPERWAKELGLEEKVGRCGWMPFLSGKRNCIGKDFAWNELLLVVSTIFRRYEVSLPDGYPEPKRSLKVSLQPEKPIPFLVRRRVE